MDSSSDTIGAEQLLGVLRRRLPLAVVCVILVGGAAFAVSKLETKKYTATASIAFSYDPLSQQIAGLSVSNSASSLLAQQSINLERVKLGDTASQTATALGHGLTRKEVASSLSIATHAETNIVSISATSSTPSLAAAIANSYADQFVKEEQVANRRYYGSALAVVHKQLAKLSPQQRVGRDGAQLQDRAQTLSLLSELNYGDPELAQKAVTPVEPSSPKAKRNTALGVLIGLLLGIALSFVLERFDRRIRRPQELETIYRLPLLGYVPQSTALSRVGRRELGELPALPFTEAEAFGLISAHIQFFAVRHAVGTVAVASATPEDGRTTIAQHLAEAAVRLGSRTLLIEADLRRPVLARLLRLGPTAGLSDVLLGAASLRDAIQPVVAQAERGESSGHVLDVLPAGSRIALNPGELLNSSNVKAVLDEAAQTPYDLVVIDTPPLSAVPDAFPLLTIADGVLIVGRLGHSRRDDASRLQQVLEHSEARLLGVVANGIKPGSRGKYAPTASAELTQSPAFDSDAASESIVSPAEA